MPGHAPWSEETSLGGWLIGRVYAKLSTSRLREIPSKNCLFKTRYFPLALDLLPPFPNDFPSNPGRDFPLAPLFFSFLFSFLLAILSARFFCRAAIFATSCSFRSPLVKLKNQPSDKNENKVIPSLFAFRLFLLFPLGCLLQSRLVVGYLNPLHPGRGLFPFLALLNLLASFFW